jgi:hypothetical protein
VRSEWADPDSARAAAALVRRCLAESSLERFQAARARRPIIALEPVKTPALAEVSTAHLVRMLERSLRGSGMVEVIVVPSADPLELAYAGADFLLVGSLVAEPGPGGAARRYEVVLSLTDLATGLTTWSGFEVIRIMNRILT